MPIAIKADSFYTIALNFLMFLNDHRYIPLNYTLALNVFRICVCVLFISLMHSVNRAQVLNVTFLSLLFALPAAAVFETGIVPFPKYVCITVII